MTVAFSADLVSRQALAAAHDAAMQPIDTSFTKGLPGKAQMLRAA